LIFITGSVIFFHATPRSTSYSLAILHSNAMAAKELGYRPRSMYWTTADAVNWFLDTEGPLVLG
jgi:hypothetical protein